MAIQTVFYPLNSTPLKSISLQFRDMVWDHVKSLAQVQADDISYPSLFCWCHHSITEGHEIGEAQSALGKAMLAVLGHLFILYVPLQGNQEDLLPDLPRHRSEVHWPVVPQVILFPFLKNGSNISLFPVTGDFTWWNPSEPERKFLPKGMKSLRYLGWQCGDFLLLLL